MHRSCRDPDNTTISQNEGRETIVSRGARDDSLHEEMAHPAARAIEVHTQLAKIPTYDELAKRGTRNDSLHEKRAHPAARAIKVHTQLEKIPTFDEIDEMFDFHG